MKPYAGRVILASDRRLILSPPAEYLPLPRVRWGCWTFRRMAAVCPVVGQASLQSDLDFLPGALGAGVSSGRALRRQHA